MLLFVAKKSIPLSKYSFYILRTNLIKIRLDVSTLNRKCKPNNILISYMTMIMEKNTEKIMIISFLIVSTYVFSKII